MVDKTITVSFILEDLQPDYEQFYQNRLKLTSDIIVSIDVPLTEEYIYNYKNVKDHYDMLDLAEAGYIYYCGLCKIGSASKDIDCPICMVNKWEKIDVKDVQSEFTFAAIRYIVDQGKKYFSVETEREEKESKFGIPQFDISSKQKNNNDDFSEFTFEE